MKTYMVSWYDAEEDQDHTDQFSKAAQRDAWAEELHNRQIEVTVWTQTWS